MRSAAACAVWAVVLVAVIAGAAEPASKPARPERRPSESKSVRIDPNAPRPDYLGLARAYADAMIGRGRDHYGTEQSPMFASVLDRVTMTPIGEDDLPKLGGIRPQDRDYGGGNILHDQQLLLLLYRLTEVTKDATYAKSADETLAWFFSHCQSPKTGLMAWGEHIAWNFTLEGPTVENKKNPIHEFFEAWELWPRVYKLAPAAADTFALGLWNHQIADQQACLFSRHARWDEHGTSPGSEYPRHGGFYVGTWAQAYANSTDANIKATTLTAIECLVDSFATRRLPSGVLPVGTDAHNSNVYWPSGDLIMAIEFEKAAPLLPKALAAKLRDCTAKSDATILALPHDLKPGGDGFVFRALASSNQPGDGRAADASKGGKATGTPVWGTGYGQLSHAEYALLMLTRFEQAKTPRYRELALAAADLYLDSVPNLNPHNPPETYPAALAGVIQLMLQAHATTGEEKYLKRADFFGRVAVAMFLDSGSPLPKAGFRSSHYETITGGDDLMLTLAELHQAMSGVSRQPQ